MALEERRKFLWHAFNALDEQKSGTVQKSQLKVLTHNVGSVLQIPNAQDGLHDYRSTPAISFMDYMYYLEVELFHALEDNNNIDVDILSKIDDICWMVCSKKYLQNITALGDPEAFSLLKVFNFLAECGDKGEVEFPLKMDREEVGLLLQRFVMALGRVWNEEKFRDVSPEKETYSFSELLMLLQAHYCANVDATELKEALKDLQDEICTDVIKKGFLYKKGHKVTNWKERWFIATPKVLKYYSGKDMKEKKGQMAISPTSKVEVIQDKGGLVSKSYRFLLVNQQNNLEMSASDLRTRNEWITALKSAIEHAALNISYQKQASQRRKSLRDYRRAKQYEEECKRRQEAELIEKQRQELEAEKQARKEAEARLQEEEIRRAADEKRLQDIQELNEQLEKLYSEEKQARRDEEIVRALSARLLEEETVKREELEALQSEREAALKEEREKRSGLEEEKAKQEQIIVEEREKLEKLEADRKAAEAQLKEALKNLDEMQSQKEDLEAKSEERMKPINMEELIREFNKPSKPILSHRGPGAFCKADFGREKSESKEPDAKSSLD